MKFDFWFELPEVLVNINADLICTEDKEYSKLLCKSQEVSIKLLFLIEIILNFNLICH